MINKFALTILMLTGVFFASATAQNPAHSEKQIAVKELVAMINGNDQTEQMMNAMNVQMELIRDTTAESLLNERTDLTSEERKSLESSIKSDPKLSVKRFHAKLLQKLNLKEVMDEFAYDLYDKYYTIEEIKDLVNFYKTPTGRKSLQMVSVIGADTMQRMQERLMPQMQIVIKEITEEDKLEIERKINAEKPKPKKNASR